ncbi:MAG: leucine-rich repeat protein [Bacilli bacterium]
MNKKGFTLIELLAVVIILAVVLLIAVPTVLNLIEKTNKEAFKTQTIALIKAAEKYVLQEKLSGKIITEITDFSLLEMENKYTEGKIIVNEDDSITLEGITNGKYCAYEDKHNLNINKGKCINPIEKCFTFDEKSGTINDYDTNCKKKLQIPNTIKNITVKNIGDNAFDSKGLTSVVIPSTVIFLGDNSFSNNQLTTITIEDVPRTYGYLMFENNNNLETVIIKGNNCNSLDAVWTILFENNPKKICVSL